MTMRCDGSCARRACGFAAALAVWVICAAAGAWASPYTVPNPYDFIDVSQKTEVPCAQAAGGNTMVALVLGQSNSANHGETRHAAGPHVFNFFDNKCYLAGDPLLGATGTGGSVWTRLGDMLVERGAYDNVIFISIGVGGTQIRRWTPGGDLNRRIIDVVRQLKKSGLKPTHVFWHQGESDARAGTTRNDYMKMFLDMVGQMRDLGIDAPVYVAVATLCGSGGRGYEVQLAQRELVDPAKGILPGAYSDELTTLKERHDGCHFSAAGLLEHAEMWYQSVTRAGK